jgi:GxxExxY protein
MTHEPIPQHVDDVARAIVDSAFEVRTPLGPGLLESVYEKCLARELGIRGLRPQRQVSIPVS